MVAEVELEGVVITVAVAIPVLVGVIPVFGCLFCLRQAGWGLLVCSRRRSERFPVGDSGGYALGGNGPVISRKAGINGPRLGFPPGGRVPPGDCFQVDISALARE